MHRHAVASPSLPFALIGATLLTSTVLSGCDSGGNPGTGGMSSTTSSTAGVTSSTGSTSSSSSTSSSTSSASSGSGGAGPLESGLYGLASTYLGIAFVKVDAATGSVTSVLSIAALTPNDISPADAAVDTTTRRYAALVSDQNATPDLAVIDGGSFSKVTAEGEVFGLFAKTGTGNFFCLNFSGPESGLDLLDGASGEVTKISDLPPANLRDTGASNGTDRYFLIAGSDGAQPGQWLFTWDTTNGMRTSIDLPQDRKYIGAAFDSVLGHLFVLTFDAGATPLIHVVDMDKTTGTMTNVLTLPITPNDTAPEDDLALDDVAYDSTTHRLFVVAKGSADPGPIPDQLFVIDTTNGQVVSSPMLAGTGGSLHGLRFIP
jgi:hypothetical protein